MEQGLGLGLGLGMEEQAMTMAQVERKAIQGANLAAYRIEAEWRPILDHSYFLTCVALDQI